MSDSTKSRVVYKLLTFMDYPNHRVGNDGSVWSRLKKGMNGVIGFWHRKKSTSTRGKLVVNLGGKLFAVHKLVLLAFVGPCPKGMECCHYDGDVRNNRLNNIRWDTHLSNEEDKRRHGTGNVGEKNHSAKLTVEKVREIRSLYMTGQYNYARLTKMYGITVGTLSPIISGRTWNYPECFPDGFVPIRRTREECFQGVNRWSGTGCK